MTTVSNNQPASQEILNSLGRKDKLDEKKELDTQSRFLKLLTTQLQNQDPLNPVDNAETTSQLAQISTVDGIERLNTTMGALMGSYKSNETLQAAALVGRQVMLEGKEMPLKEGMGIAGIKLDGDADKIVVGIKDANGIEVARIELEDMDAGSHPIVWDGKLDNGTTAADGTYTLSVTATMEGEKVVASTLQMATVTNVVTGGTSAQIDVGKLGRVTLDEVRLIL